MLSFLMYTESDPRLLALSSEGHPPLTPLDSTLTENPPACPDSRPIKPLESIANLLSPLESTLTRKALNCPNLQQITPLESSANLLSPLELTLTKNAPVSPLESTLTKSWVLKSPRITLLQKRWEGGYYGTQIFLLTSHWSRVTSHALPFAGFVESPTRARMIP
jgi:hypothetical protein